MRGGSILDENKSQMLSETKDFLIEYYKYPPEQILINYPVNLKDGRIVLADLVVTTKKAIPYMVIYVTTDQIPVDKVKEILTESDLIYGVVRQVKIDEVSEFWGIEKKRGIFKDTDFEYLSDYPPRSTWLEIFWT